MPVAERREKAEKAAAKLAKTSGPMDPVRTDGHIIARSFWGKAWCKNLESYSDYANRLPRGRSYLRNGSVLHLSIQPGVVEALVSGSSLYTVRIRFLPLAPGKWKDLCQQCAGGITSLVELLQGKFSDRVMDLLTRKDTGLFPSPSEIVLGCTCPDVASMCKHVAAVLYGVGTRLDEKPELLFTLRSVEKEHLLTHATAATNFDAPMGETSAASLSNAEVSALFGIEMDDTPTTPTAHTPVKISPPPEPQPLRTVAKPAVKVASIPPVKPKHAVRKPAKPKDSMTASEFAEALALLRKSSAKRRTLGFSPLNVTKRPR